MYERKGNSKKRLIPLANELFAVEDVVFFKLKFIKGNARVVTKIEGLMMMGRLKYQKGLFDSLTTIRCCMIMISGSAICACLMSLKKLMLMRRIYFFYLSLVIAIPVFSKQLPAKPCSTNPIYRQFDFWIGEWEVYGIKGKKAGDSKIELILDSCIILENWTSTTGGYAGKSFNTYNSTTKQWQQTWVDNRGL